MVVETHREKQMNKKEVFQQLMADSAERSFTHVIDRQIAIPTDIPKIISLVEPRRAAKHLCSTGSSGRCERPFPPNAWCN